MFLNQFEFSTDGLTYFMDYEKILEKAQGKLIECKQKGHYCKGVSSATAKSKICLGC